MERGILRVTGTSTRCRLQKSYGKRNIESNWNKYEMPPSDEEEEEGGMTGVEFGQVLASAQGASSHLRLRAEREWEKAAGELGELSQVRLTSPHLTSPHITSPHITSPHLTSWLDMVESGLLPRKFEPKWPPIFS